MACDTLPATIAIDKNICKAILRWWLRFIALCDAESTDIREVAIHVCMHDTFGDESYGQWRRCLFTISAASYLEVGLGGHRGIYLLGSPCRCHLQFHAIASDIDGWIVRFNIAYDLQSNANRTVEAFIAFLRGDFVAATIALAGLGKKAPLRFCGRGPTPIAGFLGRMRRRLIDSAASAAEIQHRFGNGDLQQCLA